MPHAFEQLKSKEEGTLRPIAIQLIIPFCIHHCPLCKRTMVQGRNTELMHAYMKALQREIDANADQFSDCEVKAIRLDGGLASMAPASDVSETIKQIKARYHVSHDVEITIRASISDISGASMPFFLRSGITRFDFEMMSLDSFDFPKVNQRDNLRDFPIVCECFLHSYANEKLGLVLAYGLKNDDAPLRRSALACVRGDASHIELIEYEGEDAADTAEKNTQLEMIRSVFKKADLEEYAPLMFARNGRKDRFNTYTVSNFDTVGFGLGAITRFDGAMTQNTDLMDDYLAHSDDFRLITVKAESLQAGQDHEE